MLIDLSCPVENRGFVAKTSSETNEPYVLLKLMNISEKRITSLKFDLKVFDENGSELAVLPVEFDNLCAEPKEYFAENKAISLEGISDAKNFVVEFTYATFDGDEPYEPSQENTVKYDDTEASYKDVVLLRELVDDAVCYATVEKDHWRCACGRPNFLDSENCVRCGRSKEDMLSKFSSKSAVTEAIKDYEEEKAKAAAEEAEILKAKKKKIIKGLIIAGIVVVALAIIAVAGYFIRHAFMNNQAKGATEDGDYLKAYEIYSETGSEKLYEIQEHVMGNTPINLMFSLGFSAEDAENIYFLAYDNSSQYSNLIKENKSTKEKTILTDAALSCLNVVGDHIYFINNDQHPCRMTKDGKTTETLIDKTVSYVCVVGCDMYYITTDYDNPNNLSEEQCVTLASQGQMDSFTRLHKYNLNTKEDAVVSEEEMSVCAIYGDRIFYLASDAEEDPMKQSYLMSMDMKGEDVKAVVSEPVMTFLVKGDDLYYVPHYTAEAKDASTLEMSHLNYTIMKLNMKTGEVTTVTPEDDMVLYLNASGDSLIYVKFSRTQYMAYYQSQSTGTDTSTPVPIPTIVSYNLKDGTNKILVTGEVNSFNISGDDVFCIFPNMGMCRMKTDGSNFENVYADGTANPPAATETPELSPDLQALLEDQQATTEE